MHKEFKHRLIRIKISTIKPSLQLVLVLIVLLSLSLFKNSKAYPYSAPENYLVVDDPRAAVSADFDGDTFLDFAVANFRSNQISVLINNQDSTFKTAVNYSSIGKGPRAMSARDFDGDLDIDLVVVNYYSRGITLLLNDGTGVFSDGGSYDLSFKGNISSISTGYPTEITTTAPHGLENNDGGTVYFSGSNSTPAIDGSYIITVTGPTTFTIPQEVTIAGNAGSYKSELRSSSVASEDFNGDSFYDLVVSNNFLDIILGGDRASSISVLLNDGTGHFLAPVHYKTGPATNRVLSADFDGDGKNDLLTLEYYYGYFTVYKGNGDGSFNPTPIEGKNIAWSSDLTFGDFDGDSDLDVAVIKYYWSWNLAGEKSIVEIYKNNGAGHFTYLTEYTVGAEGSSIIAGDFTDDSKLDLAVSNYNENSISILKGLGTGYFTAEPNITTPRGPIQVISADIDKDNRLDLVSVNKAENGHDAPPAYPRTYSGNSISIFRSGVLVMPSDGKTLVTETGITDSYNVVLASAPTANVLITLSHDAQVTTDADISGLTFTTLNWNTPQTVIVTAVNDLAFEGEHSSVITHTSSSVDLSFNNKPIPKINVRIIDDEGPDMTISESGNTTEVKEGSTTDTFSVVLNSQPAADVNISLVCALSQLNLSSYSLTFTNANWSTPQLVTVTAVVDSYIEGTMTESVILTASSADPLYNPIVPISKNVLVNVVDQNIIMTNPICQGRSGDLDNSGYIDGTDNFLLNLTIRAIRENDNCTEYNMDGYIGPPDSSLFETYLKNNFNYTPASYEAVVVQVDGADRPDGLTNIGEDGTIDYYQVYLNSRPATAKTVTIDITPDAQEETSVPELNFNELNYFAPQKVTVSAVDNAIVDGTRIGNIIQAVSSTDLNYNGIPIDDVSANIADNDVAGVTIIESGSTDVVEGGATDSFTVQLDAQPTVPPVTITLSSPDSQLLLSPSVLTFTDAFAPNVNGWDFPHEVTVTAVDDSMYESSPHSGTIEMVMESSDPVYLDSVSSFAANITDNDPMPSISIADSTVVEGNSGTSNLNFTVTLTPVSGLMATVSYDTADGTATVINNDYIEVVGGTLTFNPGETTKIIAIEINGDADIESNENFLVNLSAPINAIIGDSQGEGVILEDDNFSGTSTGVPMPTELICQAVSSSSLNWVFHDNAIHEIGFKLYGLEGLSLYLIKTVPTSESEKCEIGADEHCRLLSEDNLSVNTKYIRRVSAYVEMEESSKTIPVTCFTLANKPNKVDITKITADSISIKLDPNDGNPPETKYAIRVISGTIINYVNPDGSISPTENWYTYVDFGGANGVTVTGVTQTGVTTDGVQMVIAAEQNYSFSAKAKNGDGVETVFSDSNDSIPQTGTMPNITAVKGVAVNLAWNSSFGLFSTAWAGDNLVIDINGTLNRVFGTFSWLLNIILLVLLVTFGISLVKTVKHLKHKYKYPDTFKLIWSIIAHEAHHTYNQHAPQTEEGVYHSSTYHQHKKLQNLSQNTFFGTALAMGLKLLIIGALFSGLISLNHNSLAASVLYNQNGTQVTVGDALSYMVEVKNSGTAVAQNIKISDTLDSALTYRSWSAKINLNGADISDGITVSGNNLLFDIGDLGINENAYVIFKAVVRAGTAERNITNMATVTGTNITDLNTNTTSNEVEPLSELNENINQPEIPPINKAPVPPENDNINQPPPPPTNGNQNVNQVPIISPIGEQPPQIPIMGSIISSIADIIENPRLEQASQNIITPILIIIAAINILPVLFNTLYLLPFLHLLFLEPLMIFFGKKRKKWGVVYNSLTKLPVDLALVRLYNKATNQLVQTKVTDRDGRYIMIAKEPGKYYLSVSKPGFISPSSYLRGETNDSKYIDLYHGEVIEVTEKDAVLTANIPLDPAEKISLAFNEVIRAYLVKNLRLIVSYVGMILALIVVLIIPTSITISCLFLHIIFFLAFRRFILPAKPKSWGIVYDAKNKAPLGSSVVRIFDTKFNKLLETQVTDSKGRYAFLVGKNEYQLLTEKPGYQNKSVKPVDLIKNEEIVNLDVSLDKI